ncbi:tyrosine-type recombinase/integrase [Enterococcus avium]|uniref:tyrosine-type recombinase/integrase n=1 Tax=Enterococcus avium TaxID=33945 RepID=UPI00159D048A|nr:site-specific integrase [Enterococcus avium]NVN77522.1 tyrosine-type recombinase/integrase [Enterococcus avium]
MNKQRTKGENIYYRKDGRWEGRYVIGRKSNGRLKYGYVYGKTYQTVRDKLLPLKQQANRMIELYGKSLMTYNEWVTQWKKEIQKTIKLSTYSDYCYKLSRYLLPHLGTTPLYQVTTERIQEIIDIFMKEKLSPSSIQIIHCLLKKTLNDAKKQGLLYQNPCEAVQLPKRIPKKVRALTIEQQRSLLKVVDKSDDDKDQAVTLALNTGMRIGEIAALKWENIDFNRGIISITQTCNRVKSSAQQKTIVNYDAVKSTASHRIIPMNQKVSKLLKELKKKSDAEFVFSIGDKGCEPRVLTYHFHQLRKQAKLENIHFHQLRHTFATRCLEAKVGITSVSALLGHASTKMTLDVYSDSMLEERVTAVYAIEAMAS